jgi:hypothetical protein
VFFFGELGGVGDITKSMSPFLIESISMDGWMDGHHY